MKKILIVVQIIIASFIYAYGGRQADSLNYYYVQFNVINLSDTAIDFYYNTLTYRNVRLEKGESETTYKTPITDDFPGFFAIDRGNKELEIYTTHYINERKTEFGYAIVIYNETIDFYYTRDLIIERGFSFTYLTEETPKRNYFWEKLELQGPNIIIEIQNMTGVSIDISSNGYAFGEKEHTEIIGEGAANEYNGKIFGITLENNSKCLYTIDTQIFSLKYIYFHIGYPKIYLNEEKTRWDRLIERIDVTNQKQKNIVIVLNGYDKGYEIRYR